MMPHIQSSKIGSLRRSAAFFTICIFLFSLYASAICHYCSPKIPHDSHTDERKGMIRPDLSALHTADCPHSRTNSHHGICPGCLLSVKTPVCGYAVHGAGVVCQRSLVSIVPGPVFSAIVSSGSLFLRGPPA